MRNLVLMVSIGNRPWVASTAATFEQYCKNIGADFVVRSVLPDEDQFPLPPLADYPGRKNKASYASKTFFAYHALDSLGYDRVLVVDDTCVIWPHVEDIFDIVPYGTLGYTSSNSAHAEKSFSSIADFCAAKGIDLPTYRSAFYMNSGVILYDRSFKEKISAKEIVYASDLLYSTYPHQTLLFFLILKNKVKMTKISKAWNLVPQLDVSDQDRNNLKNINKFIDFEDRKWNILHFTGGSFQYRYEIVHSLAQHVLRIC